MNSLSEKEIIKIKNIQSQILGFSIKEDFDFILKKEGKEGVRKIEEALEKYGYSIKYEEVKTYKPYPLAANILILYFLKEFFNWQKKEFQELGRETAKLSLITKIMIKYFISLEKILDMVDDYWKNYFTAGKLIAQKPSGKNRSFHLIIEDFQGYPLLCWVLEGFFRQVSSYVLPFKSLRVEEKECPFRGGKVHCFRVSW